jgi:hypothetical protein
MTTDSIAYYGKRMDVIFIASTLYSLFAAAYLYSVYRWDVLKPTVDLSVVFWLVFALQFAILLIQIFTTRDKPLKVALRTLFKPHKTTSMVLTIIGVLLFFLLISVPIFLLGGALQSPFAALLTTVCAGSLLVSKSIKVRTSLFLAGFMVYILSAKIYFEVTQVNVEFHGWFQIAGVALSLIVTYFLSSRGEFTIFDETSTPTVAPSESEPPSPSPGVLPVGTEPVT